MRGVFTRDERVVVCFLAASLAVGSLVLAARRVEPALGLEETGAAEEAVGRGEAAQAPAFPIDVNVAGPDELIALPGIGPVRADAIVRLREERGGFGSVEELLDVKGIGPVTLERLRPLAVVGGAPAAGAGRRAPSLDSVASESEATE
jgi:competence protein ComEA